MACPLSVGKAQQKLELGCDFRQAFEMADAKRVLIVDDDTAVLRIMREALQNFLHWEVENWIQYWHADSIKP